jgi:tetratricopeptide (TPR) repeat protein
MASPSGPPKVFISYAWEEEPHPTWVGELATRLRTKDGLDVTLDRWAAQPGDELTLFMEKGIRDSRFVLMICTPLYKAKFDERLGGVGYEARNIAGEIYTGLATKKIIPIHRQGGKWAEAAPTAVLGSFYVNLTGDPFREVHYRTLVDFLHGRREVAPRIGHGDTLFEGPGAVPATPVANFSGRDQEMASLVAHLRAASETAVCVVASGIGGVGKTSLARQLVATRAADLFPEGAAWLDGANLVSELVRVCGRFGWPEKTDPTPQRATAFLTNQLHRRPILLVVDNLPAMADSTHVPIPGGKCRTLITSRSLSLAHDLAVPAKTIRLEHWSPEVSRQYLQEAVPHLAGEPDTDLEALSRFVQGLPLAVRLIARALARNVSRSAKQHLVRLQTAPLGTLDGVASAADRGIAATFLDAYRSLTQDEQAVLRALASCARGTRAEIVAAVAKRDLATSEDALNALARVSLAEFRVRAHLPWHLHDVVRFFVRAQPESARAEAAHLDWVREHLRKHEDPLAHEALEEGIAEAIAAFERLLSSRDNSRAGEVLFPIYLHLMRRGRCARAAGLTERLLGSLGSEEHAAAAGCLGNLGLCYRTLGDIPKAIDCHQRSLALDEKLGSLEDQAKQLGNLGYCYVTLGVIPKAIDFFQGSLALYEKLGSLGGQATQLGDLGLCYRTLGDIQKAIDCHQRSLAIEEKLGSLGGQATQLGRLGVCYQTLDDIPKAIDFHQRADALYEELGSLEGHAASLGNLGNCYETLGDIPKAIDFHQRADALYEELGSLEGQAGAIGGLGHCYLTLGDIPRAIDFIQRSRALNERLGSLEGQAIQLENLGLCYQTLGDIPKAIDFLQRSLAFLRAMGLTDGHPNIATLQRALAAATAPSA